MVINPPGMQAQLTLTNLKKHPNANGYILDLKMTQIESLWSIFERLKPSDISELILSYNSITTIEPAILKMKNLLTLNYSVNQIKNIANLDNLQRLESLNLSTNRINIINNLDSLKSLIRLV